MAIKNYTKGKSIKLSANFCSTEFDCNGTGCCAQTPIDEQLVTYLQKIRDHFGAKVTVAAGYRCATHNAEVPNAAPKSKHTLGMAADIKVDGIDPLEVAQYAESIGVLGIGHYDTFVHIDTRTTKSFWYSHAQVKRTTFQETMKGDYTMEMRTLKKGMKGEDVKAMQILLEGRGYPCGKGATGSFGSGTESAVKKYQKAKGLTADGIVGELTMKSLMGL